VTDADRDRALLAAHVAGSPDAFGELVRTHQQRLWAVALRTMRDPDDAADVLQEALIKAFRSAGTFRGDAAVSTWLYRIVMNAAFDALRRRTPVPVDTVDVPDPRDEADQAGTALDVADALARLPLDQRAALVLVDLQGFSVEQAAEVLECPVGTVKSRCFRARARLAQMLEEYRNHPAPPVVPSVGDRTRDAPSTGTGHE
jgi:RNA polymerase sigma-70 factor (ECF subfamily)